MILDKKILSIDQTTSAAKALLLRAVGHLAQPCTETHQHFSPQPDGVENHPIENWENSYTAIRKIITEINSAYSATSHWMGLSRFDSVPDQTCCIT